MHSWVAVDFRIFVAPTNHGYSISAQIYEFCPHLAQLDNLDFTLSHKSKKRDPHIYVNFNIFFLIFVKNFNRIIHLYYYLVLKIKYV